MQVTYDKAVKGVVNYYASLLLRRYKENNSAPIDLVEASKILGAVYNKFWLDVHDDLRVGLTQKMSDVDRLWFARVIADID